MTSYVGSVALLRMIPPQIPFTIVMSYLSPNRIFAFIMNSAGAVGLFVYRISTLAQLWLRSQLTKEKQVRPAIEDAVLHRHIVVESCWYTNRLIVCGH